MNLDQGDGQQNQEDFMLRAQPLDGTIFIKVDLITLLINKQQMLLLCVNLYLKLSLASAQDGAKSLPQ